MNPTHKPRRRFVDPETVREANEREKAAWIADKLPRTKKGGRRFEELAKQKEGEKS